MPAIIATRLGDLPVLCRGSGHARAPVAWQPGRIILTAGHRLVAVPAALLLGMLICYVLPGNRRSLARLVAAGCIAASLAALISVAALIFPSGQVEHSSGELVPGIDLTLRAEPSGTVVLMLAATLALIALLEGARRPLEQAALLLCLLGTALAALGGNAVLLFGGLEVGNVGAVLLSVAGGSRLSWRDRAGFTLQHITALGLLVAALRLQNQFETADFMSLPPGALGSAVAGAWAMSGVARLVAGPGLAGARGMSSSSAWTAVAAVPTGLLVLLRLLQVGGGDLPPGVGPLLMAAGLLIAASGAVVAWRDAGNPMLAGRALCTAMAGPVVFAAGISGGTGLGAFAAAGLALCLAVAMAPAWGGGGTVGGGDAARWLRALALALAAGVPIGYGAVALLVTASAVATVGQLGAPTSMAFGLIMIMMVGAGTLAARAALAGPAPHIARGSLRLDALVAVALGVAAGVVPGLVQVTFVSAVVGDIGSPATAVDWMALRGAGGAWPAGYLTLAAVICIAVVASVAVLLEWTTPHITAGTESVVAHAPGPMSPSRLWPAVQRVLGEALPRLHHEMVWFDRFDEWMVPQPGFAALAVGAIVLLYVFR